MNMNITLENPVVVIILVILGLALAPAVLGGIATVLGAIFTGLLFVFAALMAAVQGVLSLIGRLFGRRKAGARGLADDDFSTKVAFLIVVGGTISILVYLATL